MSGNQEQENNGFQESADANTEQANLRNSEEHAKTEPNSSTGDPTDGRKPYAWDTSYPAQAQRYQLFESLYLWIVFFSSLFIIFVAWNGWISSLLSLTPEKTLDLNKYLYYAASGMLGGVVFGMKYFYRVVARGYWHIDRRFWRFMTPFIAMTIAIVVGAMIDASFISMRVPLTGAANVSIGFFAGYFSDEAVGKMYEIAIVIFGKSTATKAGDGK